MKFILLFLLSFSIYGKNELFEDTKIHGGLEVQDFSVLNKSNPCPPKTNAQMRAIVSPENGQCVYNTDESSPYFYSTADVDWMQAAGSGASLDELLKNNSFEASDATKNWTVTSLATATKTASTFDGKQKVCLTGEGSIYQLLTDTDKFHGRKFIARLNVEKANSNAGKVCLYDGTDLTHCIDTTQDTVFREYVIPGTFLAGKTYGLIYSSTNLNGSCVDKASFQLDKNEGFVANIEGDYQSVILDSVSAVTATTNLDALAKRDDFGGGIYTLSSSGITFLRDAIVSIAVTGNASTAGNRWAQIYKNTSQALALSETATNAIRVTASAPEVRVKKGDSIQIITNAPPAVILISAKARSQVAVFPDETFSTDINPVYWKATACGENERGCYNTFAYDASNNRTMCGTRPTPQTDADIRINGFRVYTRNHNVASSCATPVAFRVMMPKNLANPSETLFKDTTRSVVGGLDLWGAQGTASMYGAASKNYNPSTGTYDFDSGEPLTSTVNAALFRFIDRSTQNNGYLVIKASKTGLGMANVPARYPKRFIENGNNWATVYSDGWVEQRIVNSSAVSLPSSGTSALPMDLLIPMRSTSYEVSASMLDGSSRSFITGGVRTTSNATVVSRNVAGAADTFTPTMIVAGWGASSVVKQYGANPAY